MDTFYQPIKHLLSPSRCVTFKLAPMLLTPLYWLLPQIPFRATSLLWPKLRIIVTSSDQFQLSYTPMVNWLECKQPSYLPKPLVRSNGVLYHLQLVSCTHASFLKMP